MASDVELLESSFELLSPRAEELADRFYERLFHKHPELRRLFASPMDRQKQHLLAALTTIVRSLRQPDKLTQFVEELAIRHEGYGVLPEHYPLVGENLVAVLAELAGGAWTPDLERAWSDAYGAIQEMAYRALEEHAD